MRCPECHRYYCRECVIEHQGRMICGECVARTGVANSTPMALAPSALLVAAVGGLLLAWLVFYYLGAMLARIPSDFFGGPT